jgi:hypothetical protein
MKQCVYARQRTQIQLNRRLPNTEPQNLEVKLAQPLWTSLFIILLFVNLRFTSSSTLPTQAHRGRFALPFTLNYFFTFSFSTFRA